MSKRKTASTNSMNRENLIEFCGMLYAIDMLAGRWKLKILYKLEERKLRFSEIKQLIPGITDRMLTLHLQEMERDGLIIRTVYPQVPPKVEYQLSESALSLVPIWQQLEHWGASHREIQENKIPSVKV